VPLGREGEGPKRLIAIRFKVRVENREKKKRQKEGNYAHPQCLRERTILERKMAPAPCLCFTGIFDGSKGGGSGG